MKVSPADIKQYLDIGEFLTERQWHCYTLIGELANKKLRELEEEFDNVGQKLRDSMPRENNLIEFNRDYSGGRLTTDLETMMVTLYAPKEEYDYAMNEGEVMIMKIGIPIFCSENMEILNNYIIEQITTIYDLNKQLLINKQREAESKAQMVTDKKKEKRHRQFLKLQKEFGEAI